MPVRFNRHRRVAATTEPRIRRARWCTSLGNLLALIATPANAGDREQVEELAKRVKEVTGQNVEIAFVDQGYTGDEAAVAAEAAGIKLVVV
ncbi:hypothetical protein BH11PLA2_BH11PLA2_22630 [soil metagenome]